MARSVGYLTERSVTDIGEKQEQTVLYVSLSVRSVSHIIPFMILSGNSLPHPRVLRLCLFGAMIFSTDAFHREKNRLYRFDLAVPFHFVWAKSNG